MSDWFWKKIAWVFSIAALFFVFAFTIFLSHIEIKDLDLWLHLASGRFILEHGFVPQVDIFSCTILGKEWINHEWLFQIILAYLENVGGFDALVMLQTAIVSVTLAILIVFGMQTNQLLRSTWLALFLVFIYQIRFTIRPDLFSILFIVLYIYLLSSRVHRFALVLWLFILQVLWVNIHGFFIIGPMMLVLILVSDGIKQKVTLPFKWNSVGRLESNERRNVIFALIAVSIACLINPHFIEGALYPFKILISVGDHSRLFFQHIGELKPPIHWHNLFDFSVHPIFKIWIVISALSFAVNFKRIDLTGLLLWLMFLMLALTASRNMVYFVFIAYIVILGNMHSWTLKDILPNRFKHIKWMKLIEVCLSIWLVIWVVQLFQQQWLRGYYDFEEYERKSEFGGVSQRNFPHQAADFLIDNQIEACLLNDFNSGAYLLGRAYPGIKVFLDGRTELYGPEYFQQYLDIWKGDIVSLEKVLQEYPINGVFLNSVYAPGPRKVLDYLHRHDDWKLVYLDYDAAIFLKNEDKHQDVINQYEIDIREYPFKPLDIYKVGTKKVLPYQHMNRAYVLYNLKQFDAAIKEVDEVIRFYPQYAQAYLLKARIMLQTSEPELAYDLSRQAKVLGSMDVQARYYMAEALFEMVMLDESEDLAKDVLRRQPKHLGANILLAKIHLENEDVMSVENFVESIDDFSQSEEASVKLIEGLIDSDHCSMARQVYHKTFSKDPHQEPFDQYAPWCASIISP